MMNGRLVPNNHQGRNGGMTVLSIMVTAYQVRWNGVLERIRSHPWEAKQLDEHGHTVLYKALSRRIDDQPPFDVIKTLVEACPEAVWEGIIQLRDRDTVPAAAGCCSRDNHARRIRTPNNTNVNTPLTVACWRRASLDTLEALAAARPSVPEDVSALVALWNSYSELFGGEQELITVLCEGGRESFLIFSKLHFILSYCVTPGKTLVPWQPRCCLHRASIAPSCSVELFQIILQKFPEQIRQFDKRERLPLHSALLSIGGEERLQGDSRQQQIRHEKIRLLLEINPQAVRQRDSAGTLPLHLAVQSGIHYHLLKDLIEVYPQSLYERDQASSLYPFQTAAMLDLSLTTIYYVLRAAPNLLQTIIPLSSTIMDSSFSELAMQQGTESILNSERGTSRAFGALMSNPVTDELKALLDFVASKEDDKLWKELQQFLRFQPSSSLGDDWLPIHAAVSLPECPMGLLRVLLHMHPEQLQQVDPQWGLAPLHLAAANASSSLAVFAYRNDDEDDDGRGEVDIRTLRLRLLLEGDPASALVYDNRGQLPLHLAAYHGLPYEALDLLILAWPDALIQTDGTLGMHPFLLAACSPAAGLTEVFILLLRAPHVLHACGVLN